MSKPASALNAVNFFLADVRDGLGPFLGVFLQGRGWAPAEIGIVMTLGGLAGMVATTPLGMLVDATRAKRGILIVSAICVVAACTLNYFLPSFGVTAAAQMATGIAAAAIGPALAGITLGIVGQRGYPHQLGRNESFNHGGNAFAAIAAGLSGYMFGIGAVFALMAAMALGSIYSTLRIAPGDIDHAAARGLDVEEGCTIPPSSLATVLRSKPLLILGVTMMLFHLANAAMLPILGQAMVARGTAGDASAFTAATIIVAQLTMIPMALLAARLAESRGYRIVFILALLALPIRGLLARLIQDPWCSCPCRSLMGSAQACLAWRCRAWLRAYSGAQGISIPAWPPS
ncbi:MAG: MFS transporter [Nitrosospira sp.]